MKRILSIALSLMMVLSLGVVSFVAAAGEPTVTLESATVEQGATLDLKLSIENNPGLAGLVISVKLPEGVTMNKATNGDVFPAVTAAKNLVFDNVENITKDGTLATLNLTVAADVSGEKEIVIKAEQAVNADYDDVAVGAVNGKITVTEKPVAVTGVSLNKTSLSLVSGAEETLVATLNPANANTGTALTWKSSNAAVASVAGGKVTALKAGTATITVTTEGGLKAECAVTVSCAHANKEDVAAKASTCTEQGNAAYTVCKDCGVIVSGSADKLPLLAHKLVEKVDAKYLKSVANCDSAAVYYKSCEVCGEKANETFVSGEKNADVHTGKTEVKDAKEATLEAEGYTGDTYCADCGVKLEDGKTIAKLEPKPEEPKEDEKDDGKQEEEPKDEDKKDEAPQTGDSGIALLIVMMTLALGTAAAFTFRRKKSSLK